MNRLVTMRTSPPETRFAQSGDYSIAYQVTGSGPLDLVLVPGFVSHLEQNWLNPFVAQFLERLASFSRLIMFDKRGVGLSDRSVGSASLEQRMDDVRAVMDAVGSRRAVLMGVSDGAPMSILFAVTYPRRVSALIAYGGIARGSWAPDYPWAETPEQQYQWCEECRRKWGGPVDVEVWAPSVAENDRFRLWFATFMRLASSPRELLNLIRMNMEIDVRAAMSALHIPTLVLHRAADRAISVGHGRYLAGHIPGAEYVELQGQDHLWYLGDVDSIVTEVHRFVTGGRKAYEPEDVLEDLSPREIEIAALLTKRFSTAEIADQLFISPKTVSKHLEHIYLKLKTNKRSDARRILLSGGRTVTVDPFW